ncbi:MAG: hypothetical protein HY231_09570 [Acidobacteria bacterium]|nr:hypothetical protein [Acidobacteriota bacterium]
MVKGLRIKHSGMSIVGLLVFLLVGQRDPSQHLSFTQLDDGAAGKRKPAPVTQTKLDGAGSHTASPYHFDVWTTDNGLPQNSVNCMLQTRDGYLWLSTFDGLVRYDGVQFTVFRAGTTPELQSSRFSQLFEDRDGNLWITTEDSKLIGYTNGHFVTFAMEQQLFDNRIVRLRQEEDGALLIETATGVRWWKDGNFITPDPSPHRLFKGFGYPGRGVGIWYLDQSGLQRVENGRVTALAAISGLTHSDIKSVYEDRQGVLWVGASRGLLLRFQDGAFQYYSQKDGLPGNRINCLFEDRYGNLWLGLADKGLYRFKDQRFTNYTTANGLPSNNILGVYEDREGMLWIGTDGGLSRLRDNIITAYGSADGLAANNTYPICRDREGAIWIGTWPGLTKYQHGVFTRCGDLYGVADAQVTALRVAADGSLWIGSWGGGARRCKDGKITVYQAPKALPDNVVRAITEDKEGAMWFGTQSGLVKDQHGEFTVYTTLDGLPANAINVIFEDRQGTLWIGTQNGLCQYRDGQFNAYTHTASLAGHMVRAVYQDRDGVMWFGTYDAGLVRLKDGQFTSFTVKEGLFNNGVFQILEDGAENFWISCNLGIYRVSKHELNDYAEGRVKAIASIPYGKRDGMLNSECNGGGQPAGIKALDGKLWFPTQGGVAVVDPQAVPVSAQPPSVIIETFLLDNRAVAFQQAVEIPANIENFEIHYTGLSFIMSERLKFKYQLEGWDTEWVEADTRRVAYYSHVAPGRYTFRVIAANRDGVWNLQGATVGLRIVPPFWKTWWFLAALLAGVAGLIWFSIRLRITRLERARQAQEAFSQQLISSQENERQRIAAELHDSLGQHLLIIKNSALMGLGALQSQDRGKEQLDDISATASQAIDEVREISYNLRPYQLDDLGLTKAIEFIIGKVAGASEIRFVAELEPIDKLFSPAAEINIYRIVQESLNNIVKHSGASLAQIVIVRKARQVDLTIQDNGRGFHAEKTAKTASNGGGFGLQGIAERAQMLGAKCVITSAVGQGTTIALNLEIRDGRREK